MTLFKRRPKLATTGHAGDDQLLSILATKHGPLDKPRHWVHYLYVADEPTARDAESQVMAAGSQIQSVERADESESWVVIAERHDAVLNPDIVRQARTFFESVSNSVKGGDYDGWEASA